MNLPEAEQEVSMVSMRTDPIMYIYASDSTWITKLDKLCKINPDGYKHVRDCVVNGEVTGKMYEVDKRLISLRSGLRKKRAKDDIGEDAALALEIEDVSIDSE